MPLLTGLLRGGSTAHVARGLFDLFDRVIELLLLAAAQRIVPSKRLLLLLALKLFLSFYTAQAM